ncbi:hypothetical protein PSET11_01148 [Arthrobacter ulcerisalmonis]|uniref:Uncharacterized protein n=1 Tax=Arthrobacter ulcerisalmonis TaxID=2483813 RepID=A0A3P5WVE8_9MICC|nr:hypothetical protein PSET11_01148 [Arthrobacter ulcerisalmonis]
MMGLQEGGKDAQGRNSAMEDSVQGHPTGQDALR